MGVNFSTATEYYRRAATWSGDVISIACWVKMDSIASDQAIICLGDEAASGTTYYRVRFANAQQAFSMTHDDGAGSSATGTVTPTVGKWHHVCGTCDGLSSRALWTDGGDQATSSSVRTSIASLIDNFCIGARVTSAADQDLEGSVFWATVWQGYALTAADALFLSKGAPPWLVAPQNLFAFVPLATADGVRDWITGGAFTANGGTPTTDDSPHVMGQTSSFWASASANTTIIVPTGPIR